jgi:hypothetical protein
MLMNRTADTPDKHKSKELLIQELAELRVSLTAEKQRSQELSLELSC